MPDDLIEDVIAIRRLYLASGQSIDKEVVVLIARPEKNEDFEEYRCLYQIKGIGSEKVRSIAGIDGVQALQGALSVIGADLQVLNAERNGRLRWEGGEAGDLGF